jgi:putative transposase
MSYYERRLPHWQPNQAELFVTWRLQGSKPAYSQLIGATGKKFADFDQALVATPIGPRWLGDERVAKAVADTLTFCDVSLNLYRLRAWVLMINHVHILIEPNAPLPIMMRRAKTFSARRANAVLGRDGDFWARESFDRWIRNEKEANQVIRYIENNPVAAGLVSNPEHWRWSSAWSNDRATNTSPSQAQ